MLLKVEKDLHLFWRERNKGQCDFNRMFKSACSVSSLDVGSWNLNNVVHTSERPTYKDIDSTFIVPFVQKGTNKE